MSYETEVYEFEAGDPTEEPALYLEPGEYWFRVAAAETKRSKSKNEPMLEMKLQLFNPDGSEGPFALENVMLTPNGKWKVDQFLACIGCHPGVGGRIRIDPNQYVGLVGYADFKIDTFNDRKNNKVKRFIVPEDIIEHGKNLPKQTPPQRFAPQPSYRPAAPPDPQRNSPPGSLPNPIDDEEIPF